MIIEPMLTKLLNSNEVVNIVSYDVLLPTQCIVVWLLTDVLLMSSLRVGGILNFQLGSGTKKVTVL